MSNTGTKVLVLGMGTPAFGKERRAVNAFKYMRNLKPYFLLSKWEDGSVSRLLEQSRFDFTHTSFGYLGRARPVWTLINLIQLPGLVYTVTQSYFQQHARTILCLNVISFVNALPAVLLLKYIFHARVVFYLGDIPKNYRLTRLLGRCIALVADGIIANSQAVKRGLIAVKIPARKIEVIYNGVDIAAFEGTPPVDLRSRFGWSGSHVLVGYIGQFSVQKGVFDFVHAAQRVLAQDARCRFILVGKQDPANSCYSELSDYLKAQHLEDRVVFLGWVDEIAGVMKALDVVVVPSRYDDPAPNVNLEAMVSGIPVVAANTGGNPELIADREVGFLVEKNCPDEISRRILQLASTPELRQTMGRAGKARVMRYFDARRNALQTEDLLGNGSSSPQSN